MLYCICKLIETLLRSYEMTKVMIKWSKNDKKTGLVFDASRSYTRNGRREGMVELGVVDKTKIGIVASLYDGESLVSETATGLKKLVTDYLNEEVEIEYHNGAKGKLPRGMVGTYMDPRTERYMSA